MIKKIHEYETLRVLVQLTPANLKKIANEKNCPKSLEATSGVLVYSITYIFGDLIQCYFFFSSSLKDNNAAFVVLWPLAPTITAPATAIPVIVAVAAIVMAVTPPGPTVVAVPLAVSLEGRTPGIAK